MVDRNPSLARMQKPDGSPKLDGSLGIPSSISQETTYTNLEPESMRGHEPAGNVECLCGVQHSFTPKKGVPNHRPGYDDPPETYNPSVIEPNWPWPRETGLEF